MFAQEVNLKHTITSEVSTMVTSYLEVIDWVTSAIWIGVWTIEPIPIRKRAKENRKKHTM